MIRVVEPPNDDGRSVPFAEETNGRPAVSVLMPVYNHQDYVRQAVCSVFDQTYENIELIAVDDGSSDNSLNILRELLLKSPIQMNVIHQSNSGVSATLNRCLGLAKGDWIAIIASDDYYAPDYIRECVDETRRQGSRVVHTDANFVTEAGEFTHRHSEKNRKSPYEGYCFSKFINLEGRIVSSTMFIDSSLLKEVGGFDENLKAEDYDIQLRLSRVAKFSYINKPLLYKRYVYGGLGKRPWVWAEGNIKALRKHADILGKSLDPRIQNEVIRLSITTFSLGEFVKSFQLMRQTGDFSYGIVIGSKGYLKFLLNGILRLLKYRLWLLARKLRKHVRRRIM